jgi:serine/threonine protein phosphatase PrpC
MLSSEPDMSERALTDDDWILFLASDGVWDELCESDILNHCAQFAQKYPADRKLYI